mmetsp:Transcript_107841/g.230250  ORF Transcript_107841/g.230250 Transcript_107841/m.230250 type:complete len:225 (-) Transcript_107841:464-1138(-)
MLQSRAKWPTPPQRKQLAPDAPEVGPSPVLGAATTLGPAVGAASGASAHSKNFFWLLHSVPCTQHQNCRPKFGPSLRTVRSWASLPQVHRLCASERFVASIVERTNDCRDMSGNAAPADTGAGGGRPPGKGNPPGGGCTLVADGRLSAHWKKAHLSSAHFRKSRPMFAPSFLTVALLGGKPHLQSTCDTGGNAPSAAGGAVTGSGPVLVTSDHSKNLQRFSSCS